MSKITLLEATVLAVLVVTFISLLLPSQNPTQPASASQGVVFDHSNCQYPDRWSNPANGCDNSDPAVPECIKASTTQAGEQECIAAFVKQNEQTIVSTSTTSTTLELKQSTTNQCGDK